MLMDCFPVVRFQDVLLGESLAFWRKSGLKFMGMFVLFPSVVSTDHQIRSCSMRNRFVSDISKNIIGDLYFSKISVVHKYM